MSRGALFIAAGVVVTVFGFARTIEPVIEVGVALIIIGMITNPKPKG